MFIRTPLGTVHAIVRGKGPDVVLLHGVTDNAGTWHGIQTELAGVARTHAIDLAGHGLSDIPEAPIRARQMAAVVAAYLDSAKIESAVVVGWSLGGAVTLTLAGTHPARTRAIVLVGPAALTFPFPPLLWPLKLPPVGEIMPWVGATAFMRRLAMQGTFARTFRPSEDVLARYFRAWQIRGRARYVRALLRGLDVSDTTPLLGQIRAPAWIVHGEEDRLVPVRIGRELGSRLGSVEVQILAGVGHAPHIERPEVVLGAIAAALGSAV